MTAFRDVDAFKLAKAIIDVAVNALGVIKLVSTWLFR